MKYNKFYLLSTDSKAKKPVLYWNRRVTYKRFRKAIEYQAEYKKKGRRPQKKKHVREKIHRATLKFIHDFLTSEEQQQGVAYGTVLVKKSDGTALRIAKVIRRQHTEVLVRQLRVLLKENKMQVLGESTLRRMLRKLRAGKAREIRGLDPTYELHRRAFEDLQSICAELLDIYTAAGDFEKVEKVEKVQEGLATSAAYLLGSFAYNLSLNSPCYNHDVNLACSDAFNPNQQDLGTRENMDPKTEDYPEVCHYCNLLPAAYAQLEDLLEGAKSSFSPELEFTRRVQKMKEALANIIAHKKQIFRHWVGSKTWDQYYKDKNPKRAIVKMDFAMKFLPQKARETQTEWYAKKGWSWHAVAFERMVNASEEVDDQKSEDETEQKTENAMDQETMGETEQKTEDVMEQELKDETESKDEAETEQGTKDEAEQKNAEQWMVESEVHVQVLREETKQDSPAVVAMGLASLEQYKKAHPEIEEAIIDFDNACCYHCMETVLEFFRNHKTIDGLKILGLHFGEPGKGKCICDQYFAILKALVRRHMLAGNDVDSPEQFAHAMCSDNGVVNTIIQIGDIQGRIEDTKKYKKRYIKDISKYHEFIFHEDGILCRYLPGFGPGEFIKIDRNELETYPNAKFVYDIVNKDKLTEDLRCQEPTKLPYKEECQAVHEVIGPSVGAKGDGKMNADEEPDIDDEDMASVRLKTCGKRNPMCTKSYVSMNAYIRHRDDPNDKCIIKVEKQSSMDQVVEMYANTNGIHGRYQDKTHKETRSLVHHTKVLPAVDPLFIDDKNKEELCTGHALPPKKTHKPFTERQHKFLIEAFNAGVGKKKHRKKKPKQVVTEMQDAGFPVDEWLTEKKIKDYFARLAASQKDANIPVKRNVKQDELEQDPAAIEAAMQRTQAIQDEVLIDELQDQLDDVNMQSDGDDENPHPLYAEGLEKSLCELAADRLEASSVKTCTLHGMTKENLAKAMSTVGVKLKKSKSKEVLIDQIVEYFRDNCDCLLFQ